MLKIPKKEDLKNFNFKNYIEFFVYHVKYKVLLILTLTFRSLL